MGGGRKSPALLNANSLTLLGRVQWAIDGTVDARLWRGDSQATAGLAFPFSAPARP